MNGSFQIGTAFGIPVRIHWSFLVLLLLFWGQPWLLVAVFGSVLLHELGHAVVARRFGVRVLDITLWPLGGMARLAEMPETPRVEALVALAGPAVNVALAAASGLVLVVVGPFAPTLAGLALPLFVVNLMLGVLNLVPAFPMDGGRVYRAWLARGASWLEATEQAVRVGRGVALSMIFAPVLGAFLPGFGSFLCSLPVVGLFVLFAGMQELVGVRLRHGISPLSGVGGSPGVFGRRGARPATAEARWAPPAAEAPPAERGEARRPGAWDQTVLGGPRRGFDEDELAALERFRGRLRRSEGE